MLIPQLDGVAGMVFDLEGTLYVGDCPVEGAAESIDMLRARGVVLRFLTNTTTRAHDSLTLKLERMGFDVAADEVFCAPTAAADSCSTTMPAPGCWWPRRRCRTSMACGSTPRTPTTWWWVISVMIGRSSCSIGPSSWCTSAAHAPRLGA